MLERKGRGPRVEVLLLCGLLYLLSLRAYYVGFFNDDAFYIIGAKSLLRGRYAELNAPGQPPLVNYLPGYSLLLAPIALISGSTLWPFQLFSIAMALASLWLLWPLFDDMTPASRTAAVLAFGLSPLAVSMSATVLSEIPLLLVTIAALLLARRVWDSKASRDWAALAGLCGYACLLRPTGAALPLALVAALCLERRWKRAAFCAALAAACVGPFLLRNYLYAGRSLTYFAEIADPYRGGFLGSLAALAKANLGYYLKFLFVTTLFRWPWEGARLLEAATIGLGLVASGYGFWDGKGGGAARFARLYLVLFLLVHVFWSKQAGRYLYPVLPLCAAYLFRGIAVLEARLGVKNRAVWAVLGASLFLCAFPVGRIVRASLWERTAVTSPPERAYAWIRARTSEADVFAAELDGRLYLRTGRRAVHFPKAKSAGDFSAWLKASGARYVLVFPNDFVMRTQSGNSAHDPLPVADLRALLSDEARYQLAFEDKEEGAAIFRAKD